MRSWAHASACRPWQHQPHRSLSDIPAGACAHLGGMALAVGRILHGAVQQRCNPSF